MTGDAYAVGSFEEFWPYYVRLHQKPQTHWLHAAATGSSNRHPRIAVPLEALVFVVDRRVGRKI